MYYKFCQFEQCFETKLIKRLSRLKVFHILAIQALLYGRDIWT